jgi:adenylate cyclase, class 2
MHNDHNETELKLYVPDLAAAAQQITLAGAQLTAPRVFERNVRYEAEDGSLSARGIVLRLRQDTRARLTYKSRGALVGDGVISRPEIEVEVGDFATMDAILSALGYYHVWYYEKYRTTYHVDNVEIVLDEMPYGNFVEIEGHTQDIEKIITRIGLSSAARIAESYTALFAKVKHTMHLPFRDLTFENFKSIVVPEKVIIS